MSWRDNVRHAVAARQDRAPRRSAAVNYPDTLFRIVLAAAARRDLSMAAYQRRATLARACADLGLDYDAVMVDEPPVGRFNRADGPPEELAGQGHGPWRLA